MVDGAEAKVLLADAATGCGATFGGCSGCPRDEAGLNWADEAGVCSDGEDEDGLADCCAFALSVRSKKVEITQCQIRITQPSFRFCLRLSNISKSGVQWRSCSWWLSSPAGCLLGRAQASSRWVLCICNVECCRPGANGERRVKLSLTALSLSELRQTYRLEHAAIRKSPVARFHQVGAFQPLVGNQRRIVTTLLVRLIP